MSYRSRRFTSVESQRRLHHQSLRGGSSGGKSSTSPWTRPPASCGNTHENGTGSANYPFEVAETKVNMVTEAAATAAFPLKLTIEED